MHSEQQQQQAVNVTQDSAVLKRSSYLFTLTQLVGHRWLYYRTDEGPWSKPWELDANRSLMLLGKLASLALPPWWKTPLSLATSGKNYLHAQMT